MAEKMQIQAKELEKIVIRFNEKKESKQQSSYLEIEAAKIYFTTRTKEVKMRLKETNDQCYKVFKRIQSTLTGKDGASMQNSIE